MKKLFLILSMTVSTLLADGFTLKSDDILGQLSNQQVLNGFGCSGENISPALSWENIPNGTKSFAVTMYDKDAPTGSGWWHWVVFDIPKNVTTLAKNSGDISLNLMPKGVIQGKTDFGKAGYGGACPPVGDRSHQYLFTIYALDTEKLGVGADASPSLVGYMINSHTIAKASVVTYYGR